MSKATVSSRGQLIIPRKLREKYGIKSKSKVEWLDMGNGLALIPIAEDPVKATRGILRGKDLRESLLKMKKQERERGEKRIVRFKE